jgi:hypothetical protein
VNAISVILMLYGDQEAELPSNKESLFAVVGYRQSCRYSSQKQAQSTTRQHFEFHSYSAGH